MKLAKNYEKKLKNIEEGTAYDAADAIAKVVENATAKFDETIELHIKLGVDSRQADQQVRGTIVMPSGTGKKVRALVIAKGDKAIEAEKAGADIVGGDELIAKIAGGWLEFDVCITTPDMMPVLGRVAKVLGPKGLMPNPKSGTVTTNVKQAIDDVKAGKVEYRLDKTNIVHVGIGKASFGVQKLMANYEALMGAIVKAKPAAAKGQYIKSLYIASTMGPSVKINYKGN